jgi:hypothetical protein
MERRGERKGEEEKREGEGGDRWTGEEDFRTFDDEHIDVIPFYYVIEPFLEGVHGREGEAGSALLNVRRRVWV